MTETLEQLEQESAEQAEARAQSVEAFERLAGEVASGAKVATQRRDEILAAADKTVDDLITAVKAKEARAVPYAKVARLPGIAKDRETVTEKLLAANRLLEEAEQRHAATVRPLYDRLHDLEAEEAAAHNAIRMLARDCPYESVKRRHTDAILAVDGNRAAIGRLQQVALALHWAPGELADLQKPLPGGVKKPTADQLEEKKQRTAELRQLIADAEAAEKEIARLAKLQPKLQAEYEAAEAELSKP